MLHWLKYAGMSERELDKQDLLLTNLACCYGLPNTSTLHLESCIDRCDTMAQAVEKYTDYRTFRRDPAKWDGSYAIFRMHVLLSTLRHEFGVRYNPDKRNPNATFDPVMWLREKHAQRVTSAMRDQMVNYFHGKSKEPLIRRSRDVQP
jgi:hypothetical protein